MAERVVDVISLFQQAALEVSNKKLEGLSRATVLSQLGMDSVAVMELLSFLEEKLAIRLPDEDLARVNTLGDLCNLIQKVAPPGIRIAA